jgi:hypothetical protein
MSSTKDHPLHKSAPVQPSPAAATQAPAYVPLKWSYPFTTAADKDGNDAHAYFEALSNAEDGFYPHGANGIWHGGIHFGRETGQILKQENGFRAIADGEVVAYRLDSAYPVLKYEDGKQCMYSTGFVLVRHKLQLPPAPSTPNSAGGSKASTPGGASTVSVPASTSTPAPASAAPADETLTFFSLYVHTLDWRGYKAAIEAGSAADATPSPIKCMPYWKGDKHYRVGPSAADTQRQPSTFDFSLPDSMRLDAPDGDMSMASGLGDPLQTNPPTLKWLEPVQFPAGMSWPEKFRLIDQHASADKPKAKQPAAKGTFVYSKANGEAIGLLPQGSDVQLGLPSTKAKGWAQITKVLKGEPVGAVIGDPVDPRVATGWVKVEQFEVLIDPQPLDTVVVLDTPYPVAAGAVLDYLGEYQRYREASKLPPTPQRPILHLEVFAGPDLPAFIKKSQARAKQLPDKNSFLGISAGAMLVDVAGATQSVDGGLLLKPVATGGGEGPWVKVQPTLIKMPAAAPPQPGHGHAAAHSKHPKVKPEETSVGSPVWVERAMAGKPAPSGFKAWRDFPLQVSNAKSPAAGFDEVYSRGELDKLGADAKAQDDKKAHWWKVTVGTSDGNSREGWVCDTGHPNVQPRSAWEWPGFELIDNTSVSVLDSFKRFLYVQELLFDGDKESFEPSAVSVNGSALVARLEKVVDRLGNKDGKVTPDELARAQRTRWVAQAISHLVVRYESEWGGDLSKWESLSSLMKERKYIWQGELERIGKLRWWDQVRGVEGLPGDAAVYHLHPVGIVANFYAPHDGLAALIQRIGDVISLGEGTYESYNTGTHGKHGKVVYALFRAPEGTVTGKTINEILASVSLPPEDHGRLFTTGKYQTIIPTLAAAKEALGLSGDEKYDAQMQERVFRDFLFDQTPGLSNFVKKGRGSVDDAQYAAARQWASIAVPNGLKISKDYGGAVSDGTTSYYEEPGQNGANMKSTNKLREILIEIEQMRANGGL